MLWTQIQSSFSLLLFFFFYLLSLVLGWPWPLILCCVEAVNHIWEQLLCNCAASNSFGSREFKPKLRHRQCWLMPYLPFPAGDSAADLSLPPILARCSPVTVLKQIIAQKKVGNPVKFPSCFPSSLLSWPLSLHPAALRSRIMYLSINSLHCVSLFPSRTHENHCWLTIEFSF